MVMGWERRFLAGLEEDAAHLHPRKSSSSDRPVLETRLRETMTAGGGGSDPTVTAGLKTEQ